MRAKDMNLHFIGINRFKVKDILSLMIIPHLNGMDNLTIFQQKHIIIPHQTLRDAFGLFPLSSVRQADTQRLIQILVERQSDLLRPLGSLPAQRQLSLLRLGFPYIRLILNRTGITVQNMRRFAAGILAAGCNDCSARLIFLILIAIAGNEAVILQQRLLRSVQGCHPGLLREPG